MSSNTGFDFGIIAICQDMQTDIVTDIGFALDQTSRKHICNRTAVVQQFLPPSLGAIRSRACEKCGIKFISFYTSYLKYSIAQTSGTPLSQQRPRFFPFDLLFVHSKYTISAMECKINSTRFEDDETVGRCSP